MGGIRILKEKQMDLGTTEGSSVSYTIIGPWPVKEDMCGWNGHKVGKWMEEKLVWE